MSKICSVCGTSNPDEASFCGVELSSQAPAAPPPEGAVSDAQPQAQDNSQEASREVSQPTSSEPVQETSPELAQSDADQPDMTRPDMNDAQGSADAFPAEPPPLERSESPLGGAGEDVGEDAGEDAETPADSEPVSDNAAVEAAPDATTGSPPSGSAVPVAAPDTGSTASDTVSDRASDRASDAAPAPPAKLFAKRHGALGGEPVVLAGERLVVGRFDPSSGPVDIDVSSMAGAEHISRRHAELYQAAGRWQVRDLGSTNGVFLKRAGEASYGPRLQEPAALADGDELAFGNLVFVFRQDEQQDDA